MKFGAEIHFDFVAGPWPVSACFCKMRFCPGAITAPYLLVIMRFCRSYSLLLYNTMVTSTLLAFPQIHSGFELILLIEKHVVEPAPCDWTSPTCRVALHMAIITNFTIPFVWTSTVHCRLIAEIFLTPTEQPTTVLLAIQLWPWTSLRGGIVGGYAVSNSLFRYVASSTAHCHGARRKDFNRYRMTTAMTDCVSFRPATLRCRSVMSRALPIVLLSAMPARTLLHVLLILLNGVIAVCS